MGSKTLAADGVVRGSPRTALVMGAVGVFRDVLAVVGVVLVCISPVVVAVAVTPSSVWVPIVSSVVTSDSCRGGCGPSPEGSSLAVVLLGGARPETEDEVEAIDPVRTLFRLLEPGC